jgi:NTP pyrophosphatase (non-canonical NTP hydrolase)
MKDERTTVKELRDFIRDFMERRDLTKFHNPKDVSIALSIEANEILEHFRFKTNEEIEKYLKNKSNRKRLSHELADVLHFLVILANVTKIDLSSASEDKLKISERRYPVNLVKGKFKKYTYYRRKKYS